MFGSLSRRQRAVRVGLQLAHRQLGVNHLAGDGHLTAALADCFDISV